MTDLAVIVVSTNEAHWLRRCLPTIFEHAGEIELDVVVVDNESTDETRELVAVRVPTGSSRAERQPGFCAGQQLCIAHAGCQVGPLSQP